ncbi:MAG TPA: hypothetical protein PKC24_09000 [Cyclobacteriaceae bacterium]|nr:hypothetical protein [Cyclobacteriaceae bacterium]
MMNRLLKFLVLVPFLIALNFSVFAQEEEVTEEELKNYAIAMDSIENMKAALIETISELVRNNEVISGNRYNELSKIINDESKLAAAEAKPDEIAAVKEIIAKRDEETQKINETFQSLAREFIGAKSYNKVRKALQTDADVKAKYEAILASLNSDDEE